MSAPADAVVERVERPALRYFGGKWMLAPWILEHVTPHVTYVEPFAGADWTGSYVAPEHLAAVPADWFYRSGVDNWPGQVADPRALGYEVGRVVETPEGPALVGVTLDLGDKRPLDRAPIILALDGTWHRPMTDLELAALQSRARPVEVGR